MFSQNMLIFSPSLGDIVKYLYFWENLNFTKNKKGNVSKKLKHQSNQEAKRNISKSVIGMKVLRLRPSARVKANEDLESIGTFYSPPKISWNRSRDSDFKRKIPSTPSEVGIFEGLSESLRVSVEASLCEHLIPDFWGGSQHA